MSKRSEFLFLHATREFNVAALVTILLIPWIFAIGYCCFRNYRRMARRAKCEIDTEKRILSLVKVLVHHKVDLRDLPLADQKKLQSRLDTHLGEKVDDVSTASDDDSEAAQTMNSMLVGKLVDRCKGHFQEAPQIAHDAGNACLIDAQMKSNVPRSKISSGEEFCDTAYSNNSTPANGTDELRSSRASEYPLLTGKSTLKEKLPDLSTTFCSVCLAEYKPGEIVCWGKHPACIHVFHKDCLLPWLMAHDTCPYCRWDYFTSREECKMLSQV
jgi:hypothetical protein